MSAQATTHRVVVIGGGYAGTLAANRLRKRDDVDVTLVNPRPRFVDRIRLHQFVAGTGEATIDYSSLLGEGVELVVDSATRIDTAARTVRLASGRDLDYDYVIYAVGSTGVLPPSVPGAAEHAISMAEWESAERLRAALDELPSDAPITVVGGGLTGIETAAELAEQGRRVTLVCGGSLAPSLSASTRRSVAKWLSRHGVTVVEEAGVTEVRPDAVVLADNAVHRSALTIWAAGFAVPQLAAASGLRTDELRSAAYRRDTDQRRQRPDRRDRGRGRAVRAAAADELPGRDTARGTGRRHGAEPYRRNRAEGDRLRLHGLLRQPRPARRGTTVRP